MTETTPKIPLPRYPTPVTVYCDRTDICEAEITSDIIVDDSISHGQRLEFGRRHMRTLGWRCDETGDWCPEHTGLGCCELHKPGDDLTAAPWLGDNRTIAPCCDPSDCAPCCPHCPTCPTLQRERLGAVAPADERESAGAAHA